MKAKSIKGMIRQARLHFVVASGVYVRISRVEALRLTNEQPRFWWRHLNPDLEGGSFFLDFQDSYSDKYTLCQRPEQFALL